MSAARIVMRVAAPYSPVRVAKDLVGKTVGVYTLKQLNELSLDVWLSQGGVDVSQVKVVEISPGAMVAALGRGQVEAALISEPTLSAALRPMDFPSCRSRPMLVRPGARRAFGLGEQPIENDEMSEEQARDEEARDHEPGQTGHDGARRRPGERVERTWR